MLVVGLALLAFVDLVIAYIPARPVNQSVVNQTDATVIMNWPKGTFSSQVSFQLAKTDSDGYAEGALVHFSEDGLNNDTTTTPWIALVNCDKNSSDSSSVEDIFTLARDRGARGVLLYSVKAESCLINDEYMDMNFFERVLDVYSTPQKDIALMIQSQFDNVKNDSYKDWHPKYLNYSANDVQSALLKPRMDINSSFIVASLRAENSTHKSNATDGTDAQDASNGKPDNNNPNTGLAMIILYAITGCVSGLFIIVILSGAIRAIRHPERYGPRAGGVNARGIHIGRQSTAQGLARAVLDTFPVIKFGQSDTSATDSAENKDQLENSRNLELLPHNIKRDDDVAVGTNIAALTPPKVSIPRTPSNNGEGPSSSPDDKQDASSPASTSPTSLADESKPHPSGSEDVQPSAMGHEICPICILEFVEGDDVRILPCEGKHQFHKHCVDPWLLELSSSCPLCREDFHTLEAMLSGHRETIHHDASNETPQEPAPRSSRFSRYLRFARRRHGNASGNEGDNTSGSDHPPVSPV